jgi:hypothetical protein
MMTRFDRRVSAAAAGLVLAAATCVAADAPEIAYLYDTDTAARDAFGIMLWYAGFDVATVAMADVATHSFVPYSLIVVGLDTGVADSWGTPQAVANVVAARVPVVGLEMGGAAFFHQLGLYMSYGNCMGASSAGVVVEDPGHPLWSQPDPIPIAPDGSVEVYTAPSSGLLLFMDGAPTEVTCYGRAIGEPSHCGIASEQWSGPFVALWSMGDLPDTMTAAGHDLFTNLAWFGIDTLGPIFADDFDSGNATAWSNVTP